MRPIPSRPLRPAVAAGLLGSVLALLLPLVLAAGPATAAPTWVWPLDPPPGVVEGFDPPDDPYGTGHRGVDLLGSPGQLVLAVAPGRVTFAGQVAGLDVVVVDHGRLRSTYQPVVAEVRVGAHVAAGDRLGTLTTYGSHCLPDTCLHLGARHGETYRDPLDFLPGGPLRLLPLEGAAPAPAVQTTAWPFPVMPQEATTRWLLLP